MINIEYLNEDRTLRKKQTFRKHKEMTSKFRKNIINQAFKKDTIVVIKDHSRSIEEIKIKGFLNNG